jgi:Asp/Glu/hydantoin racemase
MADSMLHAGLIRVISEQPVKKRGLHARLIEKAHPRIRVTTEEIQGFPSGIYISELARRVVPEILKIAGHLAKSTDALPVSCVDEPGVSELRKHFILPVVGAGGCLASVCRALNKRVGALMLTENLPTPMVPARDIWASVDGVQNTTNLASAQEAIPQVTKRLIDKGVDTLALACTGFSTVRAVDHLSNQFRVTVIDPVLAMGAIMCSIITSILEKKEVIAIAN